MDKNIVFKRTDSVTYETVANEAILIDMTTGTYFSLNQVGSMFWEKIDGQMNLGDIAADIAIYFNEQVVRFTAELATLTETSGNFDDSEVLHSHIQTLADAYDMETETVADYLEMLLDDDDLTTTAVLIEQLKVEPELVEDDLLELAETMLADDLIEEVSN